MAQLYLDFTEDKTKKEENQRLYADSLKHQFFHFAKRIGGSWPSFEDFVRDCFEGVSRIRFVYPAFFREKPGLRNLVVIPDTRPEFNAKLPAGERVFFIGSVSGYSSQVAPDNVSLLKRWSFRVKGFETYDSRLSSPNDIVSDSVTPVLLFSAEDFTRDKFVDPLLNPGLVDRLKQSCYPVSHPEKVFDAFSRWQEYLEFRDAYSRVQSQRTFKLDKAECLKTYRLSRHDFLAEKSRLEGHEVKMAQEWKRRPFVYVDEKPDSPVAEYRPLVKLTVSYLTEQNGRELTDRPHESDLIALLKDDICLTAEPLHRGDRQAATDLGVLIGYCKSEETSGPDESRTVRKTICMWFEYPSGLNPDERQSYEAAVASSRCLSFDSRLNGKIRGLEHKALADFAYGSLKNPYLAGLLFEPSILPDYRIEPLKKEYNILNSRQKEAVEKALSAPGIFLLQGPPGTGKTQVITEIATQSVLAGKKVLVSSETHKAIDNVLSRLPKIPALLPVRLLDSHSKYRTSKFLPDKLGQNFYENLAASLKERSDSYLRFQNGRAGFESKLKDLRNDLANKIESRKAKHDALLKSLETLKEEIRVLDSQADNQRGKIEEKNKERFHIQDLMLCLQNSQSYLPDPVLESDDSVSTQYRNQIDDIFDRQFFRPCGPKFLSDAIPCLDESYIQNELERLSDPLHLPSPDWYSLDRIFTAAALSLGAEKLCALVEKTRNSLETARYIYQARLEKEAERSAEAVENVSAKIDQLQKRKEDKLRKIEALENDRDFQDYGKKCDQFRKDFQACLDILGETRSIEPDCEHVDMLEQLFREKCAEADRDREELAFLMPLYKKARLALEDPAAIRADRQEMSEYLITRANVFGITCKGTKDNWVYHTKGLDQLNGTDIDPAAWSVDTVIIDEVSKCSLLDILIPLSLGKKVILSGDSCQLPPIYDLDKLNDKDLAKVELRSAPGRPFTAEDNKRMGEVYSFSVFSELYPQTPAAYKCALQEQYRSNSGIMSVYNVFYGDKLRLGRSDQDEVQKNPVRLSDSKGNPLITPGASVYFVDCHQDYGLNRVGAEQGRFGTTSLCNPTEAKTAVRILRRIDESFAGRKPSACPSVGVICTYSEQVNEIEKLLPKEGFKNFRTEDQETGDDFTVSTVDGFQGDERDVIILSMVRSPRNPDIQNADFIKDWRRLNVALSRARKLLIILGDRRFLTRYVSVDRIPSLDKGPDRTDVRIFADIVDKVSQAGRLLDYKAFLRDDKKEERK